MRPIKNPFIGLDGYTCFGCSPENSQGLAMNFFEDGEEIVSRWQPAAEHAGFKGVLHGGIQASLHDEIASWVVFIKLQTAGYTASLHLDYLEPVLLKNCPLLLRSRVESREERRVVLATTLYDANNKACSVSQAVYAIVPPHIAKRMFAYPGIEAFFED